MNFDKSHIKSIGVYFFSNIASKLIPLIAIPIITNIIVPSEYGKWSLFQAFFLFSLPLINLSARHQISRFFFKIKKEELSKIIFNILFLNITSSIFFTILILFGILFFKNFILNYYIISIPILTLLFSLREYHLGLLRFENKAKLFAVIEFCSNFFLYVPAVILIYYFNYNWKGLLIGQIISIFITLLWSIKFFLKGKYITPPIDLKLCKNILYFSIPIIPHALGSSIIALSDRLIIDKLFGLEILGIYSTSYTLGMGLDVIINAFNKAWGPWIYKNLNKSTYEAKKQIVKTTYVFVFILIIGSLMALPAGKILFTYFIDSKYSSGLPIFYWICIAVLIRGLYVIIFPYPTHIGKTKIYTIATTLGAIINIALTFFLSKKMGFVGAAIATAASYFIMFIIVFIFSQKHHPMPWLNFRNKK